MDRLPVTSTDNNKETTKYDVFSFEKGLVLQGRVLGQKNPQFIQFVSPHHELSVNDGCSLWGMQVIIVKSLQSQALEALHKGHCGIVQKTSEVMSGVQGLTKALKGRQSVVLGIRKFVVILAQLIYTIGHGPRLLGHIHMDFTGLLENYMFLLIVDTH